jgi:hypothetical protein
MIGWSHKDTGKDAVTFGMEYSRAFTRRISLAVYMEMTEGDFVADTIGLTVGGHEIYFLGVLIGKGF